ncbi:MAG: hypothetical protein JNK67_30795 [Alphaproteobacteria bacterium]|nr:hypothetical protein [Alphaproteobacteria bacterium]
MSVAAAVAEFDAPTLGPALSRADGVERRACAQALQLWREAAAPRRMPSVTAIRRDVAGTLWPHLFVVEWPGEFDGSRVVDAGSVLAEALGLDPVGKAMREAWPAESLQRLQFLQETTVELMTPIDEAGRWRRGESEIVYRCVWLPLSDDQRVVTHLLGAISYRTLRFT